MKTIPVSVVIPTMNRPVPLVRMIESLLASTLVPEEFVIVDGSVDQQSVNAVNTLFGKLAGEPRVIMQAATRLGAASQRNQAMALARHDMILFCDDDIIAEPDCVASLWKAMQDDASLGGASAAIVNQSYKRPGALMRRAIAVLGEPEGETYAGRIVGPAIAFLPDVSARDVMPVQWLNLGCTLYRRRLLPDPSFDQVFEGYSIGEDISLSLRVAKHARLVNVPAARIYHDSRPGPHKAPSVQLSRMDVVNRHYIMTAIMDKRGWRDGARFLLWECCQLAISAIQQRGGAAFWKRLGGSLLALRDIMRGRRVPG
ncbi:MAG: glycosyltransferase family 2 protein [Pseudolabrys sp.]|nr:glycosyltransferase family 2 protein [Pseudolabrys sp.]